MNSATFRIAVLLVFSTSVQAQDAAEPNDTRQAPNALGAAKNVTPITRTGLTFHHVDDKDWFTFSPPAAGDFIVTITPDPLTAQSLFAEIFLGNSPDLLTGAPFITSPQEFRFGGSAGETFSLFVAPSSDFNAAGSYKINIFYYDPESYPGWLVDNGHPHTLPWSADPEKDGYPPSLEFTLGFRSGFFNDTTQARPISINWVDAFSFFATVPTSPAGTRAVVVVESSTDLKTWSPVKAEHLSSAVNPIPKGKLNSTSIEIPRGETGSRLYFRLRAIEPTP